MLVLVSYDVSTRDEAGRRRLRRVASLCEDRGQRVQNSVFECLVDAAQWVSFRAALLAEIAPDHDSLRFYFWATSGSDGWSTQAPSPRTIRKALSSCKNASDRKLSATLARTPSDHRKLARSRCF